MRLIASLLFACGAAHAACPPEAAALKTANWEMADSARRQQLALKLLEKLDSATINTIRTSLLARLNGDDPQGFGRPFAALALAEVARIDRRKPFLTAAERGDLVAAASRFLAGVRDYRGFVENEGWRHGVAHGADWMLQLSLNPALGKADHEVMLVAIAAQIAPPGQHFYIYGEGERLMAPVYYLAQRETLPAADWDAWFARLMAGIPDAATSQATLARRHNLKGFLQPLAIALAARGSEGQKTRLLPFVTRSLKQLE